MLRVTVDMLPQGDESRRREISRILIANDRGTPELGNYHALRYDDGVPVGGPVEVLNHDRNSCIWSLVKRAIDAIDS